MDKNILQKLKDWRAKTARRENVELFRVISNQAVEEIARDLPQNKKELLNIKGIKEKKYAKYGEEILAIVRGQGGEFVESFKEENKIFEVGEYLDFLIDKLSETEARINGEVSDLKFWRKTISFDLKDKRDDSTLKCYMWQNKFEVSGIKLEEGMEILIWGDASIRKQWGQLNFQVEIIELVGEGALKKAYDELKKKLELEGLFLPERKRRIEPFINKIGVVTSAHGDAIIDFRANIGSYGYKIKLIDSQVEGKQAVFSLISGIRYLNRKYPELDVIVLTRGGGGLESLQAFNTEALVREIINSKIPIIAGIGHEKDIPLAALAADKIVSTPTATALEIRKSWDEALYMIERDEKNIFNIFECALSVRKNVIRDAEHILALKLGDIFERFRRARENMRKYLVKIQFTLDRDKKYLSHSARALSAGFSRINYSFKNTLKSLAEKIVLHDPERQLKLGYSLVSLGGKIVRSVRDVNAGDELDVKVSDGEMKTTIKKIFINKH